MAKIAETVSEIVEPAVDAVVEVAPRVRLNKHQLIVLGTVAAVSVAVSAASTYIAMKKLGVKRVVAEVDAS